MVQQDVLPADQRENILVRVGRHQRSERRARTAHPSDPAGRAHRGASAGSATAARRRDTPGSDSISRLFTRMSRMWRGHVVGNHQPHDAAEAPLPHAFLDGLEQIFRFQFLDGDIRVAGDVEWMRLDHVHAAETARADWQRSPAPARRKSPHAAGACGSSCAAASVARTAAANPEPSRARNAPRRPCRGSTRRGSG